MKKIFIVILALAFVAGMAQLALGSKYNTPLWSTQTGNGSSPHGNFSDTTDRCEDCHAVHLASGSYKLLRNGATSGETACEYCHGINGVVGTKKGILLNTSGHGLGAAVGLVYAPDDQTPGFSIQSVDWGCAKCHSVHNNNTIGGYTQGVNTSTTTNRMLKLDPDDVDNINPVVSGWYSATDVVAMSMWCRNCHGANYGTFGQQKTVGYNPSDTLAYGHDATSTGIVAMVKGGSTFANVTTVGDASAAPRCNQCHAASAAAGADAGADGWVSGQNNAVGTGSASQPVVFPHSGYYNTWSYSLLKSQAQSSADRFDDICNDCHYTPSLP